MPELNTKQKAEVKKEVSKQVEKIEDKLEKQVKKRLSKQLFEKSVFFGSEFKKHTATALIAAFGFLIALVWRDLIIKLIQGNIKLSVLEKYPYIAELYTAILVTAIAVLCIALISRWSKTK